jgi:hypothetical protein
MSPLAAHRTSHLLASGNVSPYQGASKQYGKVTPDRPGTVQINRTFRTGSVFDNPVELPKTLIHEGRHVEQLQGKNAGQEAADYIQSNLTALEDDAYQYERANYVP